MKHLLLAIALVLSCAVGGYAAVTAPVSGVARATATGDLITQTSGGIRYAAKVVGVKVNGATASKYYRLRVGTVSGRIVYENNTAATTGTMSLDAARFTFPGAGLYYQTDDASTNANITIYTE